MTANALYVASVGKAFQVLDCFKSAAADLSLTEIMEHGGLDKSTAQRYAYTLCTEGYLEQHPQTRRYRLGKRVLDLTFHFLRTNALVESLNPLLLDLSQATGERISLSLFDGRELVHVMRHQTKTEHYHASIVGRRVPLFCTAGGRAVLATFSDAEVGNMLADVEMTAFTAQTLITAKAIKAALKPVRAKGYAMVVDEFIFGEIALGAAVVDSQNVPYGSLHLSGSTREWDAAAYEAKFAPYLLGAISQFQRRNQFG